MFTTISTYYTFPKTIEQIRQNMTGHVTSRYQGLNSSEVGAKIENLGTRLAWRPFSAGDPGQSAPPPPRRPCVHDLLQYAKPEIHQSTLAGAASMNRTF
jgi:hypothetical protein